LKFQLLYALDVSGDSVAARPLVAQLLAWMRQTSSPRTRQRSAHGLSSSLALGGQTDRTLEPIATLESLVSLNATEPISIPQQMPIFITLAEIRLRAGDRAGARYWHERARTAMDDAVAERRVAELHLRVGRALLLQSEGKDAAALSEVGQAICVSNVPRNSRSALVRLNCVRSLVAVGKQAQAVELTINCLRVLTASLGPGAPNTLRAQQLLNQLQTPGGYRAPPWHPSQIWFAF
jgi:hypothetical protein